MNLYNLRIVAPGHYAMAKFDSDFNVAAVYNLTAKGTGYSCDCPASFRSVKTKPCKHQRALPYMLGAVNTDRFYDIETRQWHQPLAIDRPEGVAVEIASNGHDPEPPAASSPSGPQVVEAAVAVQPPQPTPLRRRL